MHIEGEPPNFTLDFSSPGLIPVIFRSPRHRFVNETKINVSNSESAKFSLSGLSRALFPTTFLEIAVFRSARDRIKPTKTKMPNLTNFDRDSFALGPNQINWQSIIAKIIIINVLSCLV